MKRETTLSVLKQVLQEIIEIKGRLSAQETIQSLGMQPVNDLDSDKYIKLEMKSYMTARYLFEECNKLFPVWIYDENKLDKATSDRKGDYTVYFKNVQEADEENKNLSANDCKEKGIVGITLEERLLLEIEYFKKTGDHLDINNWTLCSGSRHSDGSVPFVGWYSGVRGVDVRWLHPDDAYDFLCARSASFLT